MRKKIIISYIVLLVFVFQGINTQSLENQNQSINQDSIINSDGTLSSTNTIAGDYATLFSIIINEIMVDPSIGNEWIELYFTGTGSVAELNISEYQLIIDDYTINISTPSSIGESDPYFVVDNTTSTWNYVETPDLLKSEGSYIELYSFFSGGGTRLLDYGGYGDKGGAPAPGEDEVLATPFPRVPSSIDKNSRNFERDMEITSNSTLGTVNSADLPISHLFYPDIVINEVEPSATGFIEIYNNPRNRDGTEAFTTLEDIDNDGDFDLIVSKHIYFPHPVDDPSIVPVRPVIDYYENTGNLTHPQFQYSSGYFSYLEGVARYMTPNLIDNDADGDYDLIYGKEIGSPGVGNHENLQTSVGMPMWTGDTKLGAKSDGFDLPGANRYFGIDAANLDDDPELEYIITGSYYITTTMTYVSSNITVLDPTGPGTWDYYNYAGELPNVSTYEFAAPSLVDYDDDGLFDILIAADGVNELYENIGTVSQAEWELVPNYFAGINNSGRHSLSLGNYIDSPTGKDIILGLPNGSLVFYRNQNNNTHPNWVLDNSIFDDKYDVDISGWQIYNSKGATPYYQIPADTILADGEYFVLDLATVPGLDITASNCKIILMDSNGSRQDQIGWENIPDGLAIVRPEISMWFDYVTAELVEQAGYQKIFGTIRTDEFLDYINHEFETKGYFQYDTKYLGENFDVSSTRYTSDNLHVGYNVETSRMMLLSSTKGELNPNFNISKPSVTEIRLFESPNTVDFSFNISSTVNISDISATLILDDLSFNWFDYYNSSRSWNKYDGVFINPALLFEEDVLPYWTSNTTLEEAYNETFYNEVFVDPYINRTTEEMRAGGIDLLYHKTENVSVIADTTLFTQWRTYLTYNDSSFHLLPPSSAPFLNITINGYDINPGINDRTEKFYLGKSTFPTVEAEYELSNPRPVEDVIKIWSAEADEGGQLAFNISISETSGVPSLDTIFTLRLQDGLEFYTGDGGTGWDIVAGDISFTYTVHESTNSTYFRVNLGTIIEIDDDTAGYTINFIIDCEKAVKNSIIPIEISPSNGSPVKKNMNVRVFTWYNPYHFQNDIVIPVWIIGMYIGMTLLAFYGYRRRIKIWKEELLKPKLGDENF